MVRPESKRSSHVPTPAPMSMSRFSVRIIKIMIIKCLRMNRIYNVKNAK